MPRTLCFALIALVVVAMAPTAVSAHKRIAVASFRGHKFAARKLELAVRQLVGQRHRVVSIHAGRIHGIIYGRVIRRRRDFYVLRLKVVEVKTGKRLKEMVVGLRRPKLVSRVRRKVANRLFRSLDELRVPIDVQHRHDDKKKIQVSGKGSAADLKSGQATTNPTIAKSTSKVEAPEITTKPPDSEQKAAATGLLATPIEAELGANLLERSLAGKSSETNFGDFFASLTVYPLSERKSVLQALGGFLHLSRSYEDPAEEMEVTTGPPTILTAGATASHTLPITKLAGSSFLVLYSEGSLGAELIFDEGRTHIGAFVEATGSVGVEWKTLGLYFDLATFESTGASDSNELNFFRNVVLEWRLDFGAFHPYAYAAAPLTQADRDIAPIVLTFGLRYEQ